MTKGTKLKVKNRMVKVRIELRRLKNELDYDIIADELGQIITQLQEIRNLAERIGDDEALEDCDD